MTSSVRSSLFWAVAVLCCAFTLTGCSNDGKTAIQGEVTYGGEPLTLGSITFTPKSDGFRAIQTITDGKFMIEGKNGVQPGEYKVVIEGYEEVPEDDPDQVAKKLFPDFVTSCTIEVGRSVSIDVPKE